MRQRSNDMEQQRENPSSFHCAGSCNNSKCSPHMQVFDAADNHLYTLWAPCCPCQCPICREDDINVPITDPSLTQRVGNIVKVWRGCCREAFTDADSYRLTFPADMSLDSKVVCIGAAFMVEYLNESQEEN